MAVLARPLNRWVPAMLLAVLAGTLAVKLMAWLAPGWPALATVQALPVLLPPLSWPDLSIDTVRMLFGATLVMTLLPLTQATAIARRWRGSTISSMASSNSSARDWPTWAGSFFWSMPASRSFNRSGVNVEAGARTPLAAASAAVFLVLILSAVAPLAAHLPLAVVAGAAVRRRRGLIDIAEVRPGREEPLERVRAGGDAGRHRDPVAGRGHLLGITSADRETGAR